MMTRRQSCALVLTAVMGVLATASCRRNYYDENVYQEIFHKLSTIDSVDQNHKWQLVETHAFRVTANAGSGVQRVEVLTADPLRRSSGAEVISRAPAADGQTVTLSGSMARTLATVYVALVDADGLYYVKPVDVTQFAVDFSSGYTTGTPATAPEPQYFNYLFEEDIPLPGDYDYNDLVLRIALERTGQRQLTMHATVVAVGATKQMAGFVRLMGVSYDDVESVTTVGGTSFNDGLPQGSTLLFPNLKLDLLQRSRQGEAVVHLFADAHWAINSGDDSADDNGVVTRKKYNTSSGSYDQYENRVWRTEHFVIDFKSDAALNSLTQESLDPFIATLYNYGAWETHQDNLRAAQVLFQYSVSPTLKDLPWALRVPMTEFRYPREGVEIGFRKRTESGIVAMFGAYTTPGHSFGEWAEDCQSCLDWYEYPNTENVW